MWALVVFGLVRALGFLKRVEADEDALYVSNYITEVRIPLSEVVAVSESGGAKDLTRVSIGFANPSALGKAIEFLPRLGRCWSGMDPAIRELQALCGRARARNGVDPAAPFDPTEKIFESADGCVLQVGKDHILYGIKGKARACEGGKVFFQYLDRITFIRSKKSGRITAIDYWVKGKSGAFEIGGYGYEPIEMEEVVRLLDSRATNSPIQFLEE
jgi:hypothetical protein